MTTVVNLKKEDYDVYCGRGSIFGNPFEIGIDGPRDMVIKRYKEWFNHLLKDELFVAELKKLKDKKLGCYCKPLACHCDVIAEHINKNL